MKRVKEAYKQNVCASALTYVKCFNLNILLTWNDKLLDITIPFFLKLMTAVAMKKLKCWSQIYKHASSIVHGKINIKLLFE